MADTNDIPVTTLEFEDAETGQTRWKILINGWEVGNSSSASSAIEQGKWLLTDEGGQTTLRRLGFSMKRLSRTPEQRHQFIQEEFGRRAKERQQRDRESTHKNTQH